MQRSYLSRRPPLDYTSLRPRYAHKNLNVVNIMNIGTYNTGMLTVADFHSKQSSTAENHQNHHNSHNIDNGQIHTYTNDWQHIENVSPKSQPDDRYREVPQDAPRRYGSDVDEYLRRPLSPNDNHHHGDDGRTQVSVNHHYQELPQDSPRRRYGSDVDEHHRRPPSPDTNYHRYQELPQDPPGRLSSDFDEYLRRPVSPDTNHHHADRRPPITIDPHWSRSSPRPRAYSCPSPDYIRRQFFRRRLSSPMLDSPILSTDADAAPPFDARTAAGLTYSYHDDDHTLHQSADDNDPRYWSTTANQGSCSSRSSASSASPDRELAAFWSSPTSPVDDGDAPALASASASATTDTHGPGSTPADEVEQHGDVTTSTYHDWTILVNITRLYRTIVHHSGSIVDFVVVLGRGLFFIGRALVVVFILVLVFVLVLGFGAWALGAEGA